MILPPRGDTRTRLIESALQCFAAQGYDRTTIRQIATGARSNSSLVTYYFKGKAGLYQETLQYIFDRWGSSLKDLVCASGPAPPGSRWQAIEGVRRYLQALAETLMSCNASNGMEAAAMTLMAREMESPMPEFASQLMELLRPFALYLENCLRVLRPDLDADARFAMELSIHGQVVYLRNALGMLRLLRGNPSYPEDLPSLIRHFTEFSLRGIGLASTRIPSGS